MPAFLVVPHAQFSPTACVTCGTSSDPHGFVDLLVDTAVQGFDEDGGFPIHDPKLARPTIGHLYLCCTCLYQAANAAGCADPADKAMLEERLVVAADAITDLEAELDAERADKVVSLDDVRTLLDGKTGKASGKAASA